MIGNRIRELRKDAKLTMQELASRIGVTQGYISQVERGLIEPSLAAIRKISEELHVPIVSLFADDHNGEAVVTPKEKRKIVTFQGINIMYEFCTPFTRAERMPSKMEMIYIELQPHSWGSEDGMVHEADECCYVLEGVIEYHVNHNVYTAYKDGTIYVPQNNWHRLYNPGDTLARAIVVITPPVY